MKITLVNPPHSLYDRSQLAPPLGLLRLAGLARIVGAEVSIVDLNLLYHMHQDLRGGNFYSGAVVRLLAEEADVYGFTSMAVDSHVALHLARLLKEERSEVVNVLGGTHFSSVADEILQSYPWINLVVKGEGETPFLDLVKGLLGGRRPVGQSVLASRVAPRDIPPPAYDLLDLEAYFTANPRRCLDFEGGRGCRFSCAFCYSPGHYSGTRSFEVEAKLKELHRLTQLGAKHTFFVEDNFINDPARAVMFCRELEDARLGLTWDCYVTLPQLSTEVIDAMSRAGCRAIFTGVDAVGEFSQKAYRKGFHRRGTALEQRLTECVEAGITPTCAFLLSPPSHPCSKDTEETLRVALAARNCGAHVRLNTLTLYNRTKLEADFNLPVEADDTKTKLTLDVPEFVERNEYAESQPHLFPFHSRYVSGDEWTAFVSQVHCLFTLFVCYPQTLDALWTERDVSPSSIAGEVVAKVGDLTEFEKPIRRDAELATAIPMLESLASTKQAQSLLEVESHALLSQ
jgi:hypothetical protein